jgi:hypothetical protein
VAIKLLPLVENDRKLEYYKTLFQRNPNVFLDGVAIKIPFQLNLFDFTLKIDPTDLDRYLGGDHVIRKYTNKEGREVRIGFYETIMSGDSWELWEGYGYDGDWEGALDYHVNGENEGRIRTIVNKIIVDNGNNMEDYSDHSLQDLIEEFDQEDEIKNALRWSLSDCESGEYVNYLRSQIENALGEIGNVIKFNDEEIEIEVPFTKHLIDYFNINISSEDPDEYSEFLDYIDDKFELNDSENIHYELMYDGYGEKPEPRFDDRWHPSIDDNEFNSILSDRLYDAESQYGL